MGHAVIVRIIGRVHGASALAGNGLELVASLNVAGYMTWSVAGSVRSIFYVMSSFIALPKKYLCICFLRSWHRDSIVLCTKQNTRLYLECFRITPQGRLLLEDLCQRCLFSLAHGITGRVFRGLNQFLSRDVFLSFDAVAFALLDHDFVGMEEH